VNDRGPYHQGRLIDVSVRTAKLLGFYDRGTAQVRVDYAGRAALEGSDDTKLEATLRRGTPAPGPSEVRVASSRPFLPLSSDLGRASVPTPADRPFDLGHEDAPVRVAKRAPVSEVTEVTAVARAPLAPVASQAKTAAAAEPKPAASAESNFAARFAPAGAIPSAPTRVEPVSAYAAATAPAPSNGAVMSGRGLY
jgi:rare lipoprotein A